MARRERRQQPRIPCEIEVVLDDSHTMPDAPARMTLRTRNINMRGAYFELPRPTEPPEPHSLPEFWRDRRLRVSASSPPLCTNGSTIECEAEVRWVERRGPKKRVVGIGVLFAKPPELWVRTLHDFLDSLVA